MVTLLVLTVSLTATVQDSASWPPIEFPVRSSRAQIIAPLLDGVRVSTMRTRLIRQKAQFPRDFRPVPIAITFASAGLQAAAANEVRGEAPRVRSENATIARLIAQATERSATFRCEIDAINATDGLIYVHEGHCGRGVFACLMHTVELAGPFRLLHVKLDLRRSELDSMAAIGHELRHAIEALSDAHVINNFRIVSFFRQLGPTGSETFETPAARRAGFDVFDELRAHAAALDSGLQRNDGDAWRKNTCRQTRIR